MIRAVANDAIAAACRGSSIRRPPSFATRSTHTRDDGRLDPESDAAVLGSAVIGGGGDWCSLVLSAGHNERRVLVAGRRDACTATPGGTVAATAA